MTAHCWTSSSPSSKQRQEKQTLGQPQHRGRHGLAQAQQQQQGQALNMRTFQGCQVAPGCGCSGECLPQTRTIQVRLSRPAAGGWIDMRLLAPPKHWPVGHGKSCVWWGWCSCSSTVRLSGEVTNNTTCQCLQLPPLVLMLTCRYLCDCAPGDGLVAVVDAARFLPSSTTITRVLGSVWSSSGALLAGPFEGVAHPDSDALNPRFACTATLGAAHNNTRFEDATATLMLQVWHSCGC